MYKTIRVWYFFLVLIIAHTNSVYAYTHIWWTHKTYALHTKLTHIWVDASLAGTIINECKKTARDARKCIYTTVSIYGNESWFGKHCSYNSCFWFIWRKFASKEDGARAYIRQYNNLWYGHNGGAFFYGGHGWLWRSQFCTEEKSSHSYIGCPNGAKTFNYLYHLISSSLNDYEQQYKR